MFAQILDFFKPPIIHSYEEAQKAKFLHAALFIAAGASFLLGVQNSSGETNLDTFLYLLGAFCLICVPLNKMGYYSQTAVFISSLLLIMITFSLVDGVGLKDAAMIAYPSFIIFTSFLFNKRVSLVSTILTIGSVVLVYFIIVRTNLNPPTFSNEAQLIVIITLLVVSGTLLWIIMENWERILTNLREAYDLTLMGWAKALEYRDQETEGHSRRVTELCVRLAQDLDIPRQDMQHIRRGALLHDIGKMAVPDSILSKKEALSEGEWEVVKKHPVYAKEMLENITYLKPAIEIPYSHHERWNGTGYPEGLSGEEIPLSARIFAVVDVWDALVSERPYRPSWSEGEIKDFLKEQAGQSFDPMVVKAFLTLIE